MRYNSDYYGESESSPLDDMYELNDYGLEDFDTEDSVEVKLAYEDEVPEDVRKEIRTLISEYGNKDKPRKGKR